MLGFITSASVFEEHIYVSIAAYVSIAVRPLVCFSLSVKSLWITRKKTTCLIDIKRGEKCSNDQKQTL